MIDEDRLLPILESHETIGNGVYTVDETTGDIVPHSLYEQLSNPLNIYADETKITGDALRDYEARASAIDELTIADYYEILISLANKLINEKE